MDEHLGLNELKERATKLGYSRIQRLVRGAHAVPLASWNGFSSEDGSAFNLVDLYYILGGDEVTVYKAGKPEAFYALS